jgi:hypothetical protein
MEKASVVYRGFRVGAKGGGWFGEGYGSHNDDYATSCSFGSTRKKGKTPEDIRIPQTAGRNLS